MAISHYRSKSRYRKSKLLCCAASICQIWKKCLMQSITTDIPRLELSGGTCSRTDRLSANVWPVVTPTEAMRPDLTKLAYYIITLCCFGDRLGF